MNEKDLSRLLEAKAKKDWGNDTALRKEFRNNFGSYLAYVKADHAGRVRIVKSVVR